MKKLLLGACIIFSGIFSASAQLPYLQNFEASMTAMPLGWDTNHISSHSGNPGWKFNKTYPSHGQSLWQYYYIAHTYVAYVDDIDFDYTGNTWNNSSAVTCYDTLVSSSFSCTGDPNVFISFDMMFNNYTGGGEVGTIAVSVNGGVTWTTAATLPTLSGDVSWHNNQVYDISSIAGGQASVMVAFCWNNALAVAGGHCGWGMAIDNLNVYAPAAYNVAVLSQNLPFVIQVGKPYTFSGVANDSGASAITSMDMNYSVNGNPPVTQTISGIAGFNPLTSYNWSMNSTNSTFTPATPGIYTVKYWASNLNGSNNNVNKDTLVAQFMAPDSIQPKTVLFEEFMNASCNPCMYASPNLDGVLSSTQSICIPIRYHVSWPGIDYMNKATWIPNDSERTFNYYGVNAVPDARMDGSTDESPGSVTTSDIQTENTLGSPFKIRITACSFDKSTDTYSVTASIKSYGTFAAGLAAQAVLTVDTIKYAQDQSQEDPPSSFPNPNPQSYYQYVVNFPEVVEQMMTGPTGQTLGAFSPEQTQTINVTWKKTHPWGVNRATWKYDSLFPGEHIVVFVQDNNSQYVYQAASAAVNGLTGVQDLSNGVSFEMYPNPTNSNTNIAFTLAKDQNVTIQVYNMLGQQVYADNQGTLPAGEHTVIINSAGMQNGVYFVRFIADNATTTQKLIIQK